MKNKEVHHGKLDDLKRDVFERVCRTTWTVPDIERAINGAFRHFEEGHDREKCINCGASMLEYIYQFDVLDAVLLYAMAHRVQESLRRDPDFTKANAVHVPTISEISLAVRCRTTQCSKLGLVAKLKKDGKHVSGMWVITARGWAALAGKPVQRRVRVFRNEILERFTDGDGDLITIKEAFNVHRDLVEKSIAARKSPKNDYRMFVSGYNPMDWVEHSTTINAGTLF